MTQPPHWGGPPPHRPPSPQLGYAPRPQAPPMYRQPSRPLQFAILALLNWVFAVTMFGLAAFVILSSLMSDDSLLAGVSFAAVILLFGGLNVVGALSLNGPYFPNTTASRLGALAAAFALGGVLFRSVALGRAEIVPSFLVAAMLVLCLFSLFLSIRPRR